MISILQSSPLKGQVKIELKEPLRVQSIFIQLMGEYTATQGKLRKVSHKTEFPIYEQLLWHTQQIPSYTNALEGTRLIGSFLYGFEFELPPLSTVNTKYFSLSFYLKATIKTATLVFNEIQQIEQVELYMTPKIRDGPLKMVQAAYELRMESRVLRQGNDLLIQLKCKGKQKITFKVLEHYHYEYKTEYKQKTRELLKSKTVVMDNVQFTLSKSGLLVEDENGTVVTCKLQQEVKRTIQQMEHSANIDHSLLVKVNDERFSLPIVILE